jgi:NAD(P)H-hydrate epimerase
VGAAHLVARGALRAGAGLVTLLNFDAVIRQLETQVTEVMTARIDEQAPAASLRDRTKTSKVVALGPGLGTGGSTLELVHGALELACVKVLDADALTVLSGSGEALQECRGPAIITPHPGEAARLLQITVAEVEANRFDALRRLVELTQSTVVLKGSRSLVGAPGQLPHINTTGSGVLATGGAGDVLTGIIAALAVQVDPFTAALLGVGIHGLCGDCWGARVGSDRGMLASEIADEVPRVLAQLSARRRRLTD